MPRTRSTVLAGLVALVAIGALVWFIATVNRAPAPIPSATSTPGQVTSEAPRAKALTESKTPSPHSAQATNLAEDAYTRSKRWGSTRLAPPALSDLEQHLVDVACAHIAVQFTFDPATTYDYTQILEALAPFTHPDLLELAYTDATTYGPPSDFELWVREQATVTTTCAGAPFGEEPKQVTTVSGEQVLARAIYVRPIVRMTPRGGQVEQTYPRFMVYVAPPDAHDTVQVVWVDFHDTEGHDHTESPHDIGPGH